METNTNTPLQAEIQEFSYPPIGSIMQDVHQRIEVILPFEEEPLAQGKQFPLMSVIALLIMIPITAMPLYAMGRMLVTIPSHTSVNSSGKILAEQPDILHAAAPDLFGSGNMSNTGTLKQSTSGTGMIIITPPSDTGSVNPPVSSSSGSTVSTATGTIVSHPDNHVGVYLTAASAGRDDLLQSTLKDSTKVGANAIVFDVKSDRVLFNTDAAMARQLNLVSVRFNVQALLKIAQERGIYTIARFVSISDAGFTAAKPETQLKDPKSNQIITPGYIDPANTEALQYNSEIICDLAKNGVSEINLDYIRFSTSNTYATAAFTPTEKADRVEAFVRMARETIDRCGPNTKLGISTFAILGWSFNVNVATLGQNVIRFAPLVDIISPMAYPSMFSQDAYYNPIGAAHSRMYTLVYKTMIGYQKLLGPEQSKKLRPWLQGYGISVKNAEDQIQATMDSGECGFTFWNADNYYGPVYKAMKTWESPERCR